MSFDRPFRIYRQHDAMDCGPACLRMVAKHHGRSLGMQELREASYASTDGVSLAGLQAAAGALGFKARSVLVSLDYLMHDAGLPCIVHWENSHFVVVYKVDGNRVFVADPAYGKRVFAAQDFLSRWAASGDEGYALLIEPDGTPTTSQTRRRSPRGLFFLVSYLKPYRQLLARLLLLMLAGSILQLILPFLTAAIVDKGITPGNFTILQMVLAGQALLILSRTSVRHLRAWTLFLISAPLNITLVQEFLEKLARLPLRFFDTKLLGDALQRIYDHQRLETFLTRSLLNLALTVMNLLVFGIVLTIYSGKIFGVFILGTILYLLWIRLFLSRRREIDFTRFQLQGKSQNRVIQFILGMQELRLNNCAQPKIEDWSRIQEKLLAVNRKSLGLTEAQQSGCTLLQELQGVLITFLAAGSVIEGDMTLGMMLAVQFILGQLTGPVSQLVELAATAQDAAISFERIEEVQCMQDEEDERSQYLKVIPQSADITLSHVSFQYSGPYSEMILDDLSCVIPSGKITAIVGTSGSGKTTLIKLLMGMYPLSGGLISVGNLDLARISPRAWRSQCGLVMQDGYLFSDTIAGNISMMDPSLAHADVVHAARLANIDDFIGELPLGYQTLIGQDGHGLSQGQKQRILIARALCKNPDYLFLDEATNALDGVNEALVIANLKPRFKDKTVVIVAHRLSTVKIADVILVIDRGKLMESGSHHDLVARRGHYHELIKDQLHLDSRSAMCESPA
jgi:ATP-binding cassette, subfamily B, bacterial